LGELGEASRRGRVPDARVIAMKKRTPPIDPGLQLISDYEAAIVTAHDQKADHGVPAEEVARQRPAVVQLAASIGERMRAEYAARSRQS